MRKSILLIALLLCSIIGLAQNTWNGSDNTTGSVHRNGQVAVGTTATDTDTKLTVGGKFFKGGNFLSMGKLYNGKRNFSFGISSDLTIGNNAFDTNSTVRYAFNANSTITSLGIRSANESEIFKVATDPIIGAFIHLPMANSRVVIGGFGEYLLNDGYKLIVKDGDTKIEGNVITDGNIGIGTDLFEEGNDIYRLSVNGRMRAEAVKVYTDWADYVFEDDYDLPTLKEVDAFIETNGHLKDIPSAKAVEENGIDVGEMNKLLLQKIEELTLYILELNKEVEALKTTKN